jgi:predicted nucleotidyltransferase
MRRTVQGIYRNGQIELLEKPRDIDRARVTVTFLEEDGGLSLQDLRTRKDEILRVAERNGAGNVRVFGSLARGETDAASDVDFLMDIEPEQSLLDIVRLKRELRELLGCPVDVAEERNLRPGMRERVLSEAVLL